MVAIVGGGMSVEVVIFATAVRSISVCALLYLPPQLFPFFEISPGLFLHFLYVLCVLTYLTAVLVALVLFFRFLVMKHNQILLYLVNIQAPTFFHSPHKFGVSNQRPPPPFFCRIVRIAQK